MQRHPHRRLRSRRPRRRPRRPSSVQREKGAAAPFLLSEAVTRWASLARRPEPISVTCRSTIPRRAVTRGVRKGVIRGGHVASPRRAFQSLGGHRRSRPQGHALRTTGGDAWRRPASANRRGARTCIYDGERRFTGRGAPATSDSWVDVQWTRYTPPPRLRSRRFVSRLALSPRKQGKGMPAQSETLVPHDSSSLHQGRLARGLELPIYTRLVRGMT
jgi:hypothetical protein